MYIHVYKLFYLPEERMMKEANETLSAEEVARPGQSLLSTLKIFVEGLDYDPQLHVYRSMKELVSSVSQLEARLAVLEQREGNNPAHVITETEERE
jgi:hypothetical protein